MVDELATRLERAALRVRRARAEATRLRRAVDAQNRKAMTHTRAVLGGALLDIAATGQADRLVQSVARWIDRNILDPAARRALDGTPFPLGGGADDMGGPARWVSPSPKRHADVVSRHGR